MERAVVGVVDVVGDQDQRLPALNVEQKCLVLRGIAHLKGLVPLCRRAMEFLAQRGVERTVDIAIDERPKAWRQIGGLQTQRRIVQVAQADKFDELAAHGSVKELGYAAGRLGKARVHGARGGLHALTLDLCRIARKHQVVLVERGRVGHKGAASALGAHQALVN